MVNAGGVSMTGSLMSNGSMVEMGSVSTTGSTAGSTTSSATSSAIFSTTSDTEVVLSSAWVMSKLGNSTVRMSSATSSRFSVGVICGSGAGKNLSFKETVSSSSSVCVGLTTVPATVPMLAGLNDGFSSSSSLPPLRRANKKPPITANANKPPAMYFAIPPLFSACGAVDSSVVVGCCSATGVSSTGAGAGSAACCAACSACKRSASAFSCAALASASFCACSAAAFSAASCSFFKRSASAFSALAFSSASRLACASCSFCRFS